MPAQEDGAVSCRRWELCMGRGLEQSQGCRLSRGGEGAAAGRREARLGQLAKQRVEGGWSWTGSVDPKATAPLALQDPAQCSPVPCVPGVCGGARTVGSPHPHSAPPPSRHRCCIEVAFCTGSYCILIKLPEQKPHGETVFVFSYVINLA